MLITRYFPELSIAERHGMIGRVVTAELTDQSTTEGEEDPNRVTVTGILKYIASSTGTGMIAFSFDTTDPESSLVSWDADQIHATVTWETV